MRPLSLPRDLTAIPVFVGGDVDACVGGCRDGDSNGDNGDRSINLALSDSFPAPTACDRLWAAASSLRAASFCIAAASAANLFRCSSDMYCAAAAASTAAWAPSCAACSAEWLPETE